MKLAVLIGGLIFYITLWRFAEGAEALIINKTKSFEKFGAFLFLPMGKKPLTSYFGLLI